MAKLRVEMNSAGFRQILTSPEVQADLTRRGNAIATQAGEGVTVDSFIGGYGGGRAIVIIATDTPEAMRAEAENRTLTRALDAGR
jgi:hypothetical protein